jgi:predicted naringenin-chalcone synthase
MRTGYRAILNCEQSAGTTVQDVDFLAVCTFTGYVCPDVGSRLITHMGFSKNLRVAELRKYVLPHSHVCFGRSLESFNHGSAERH